MRPIVLDCTLRDGGYVNNWEFDTETARGIIDGLYESGVRYIELGLLGTGGVPGKQTKFSSFAGMERLLEDRKEDCHYAVMFTQEAAAGFDFPKAGRWTPDCIRLAYFQKTWRDAFRMAEDLKRLGYKIFLQAMATFMYDRDELAEMLAAVNELHPYAFYMVDSFSTMYPADVAKMRDSIMDVLEKDIAFGFHAHNNIQMAYANVQEFLRCETDRTLFVDGSVFGMGRGAGNVPIELVMTYCNENYGDTYDIERVLVTYQRYLEDIFRQYGWGYSVPYYLTALKRINSAYGWYFSSHGVKDVEMFNKALDAIPKEITYTLRAGVANEILERLNGHDDE